ncbi:flavin reductase family protein [Bradyrhizobium sp.]|jgi:flavin reductase (DIM6/NTAB) family NADH-FMN oxidoreductase RutF|uniref:flavin reductase family protein n=1 Tax=Bradyrhizobium sp. TaxID=376 RepID=UPI003C3E1297
MNTPLSSSSMQPQGSQATSLHGTIDPNRFRSVMGSFATGVAVITTEWNSELFGATVNSLTSVSLEPCMLLFCVSDGSTTGVAIRNRRLFSVNVLGQHQSALPARFTKAGNNRFADVAIDFSADGLPLLRGAAAQLCCRVATIHKAGDHDIILGEVLSGEDITCSPLVFHKGTYGSFQRAG